MPLNRFKRLKMKGHYILPKHRSGGEVIDPAIKQIEALGFGAREIIIRPADYQRMDPEGYIRLIYQEEKREKSYRMVKRLKMLKYGR